jgi:hypothetical protein
MTGETGASVGSEILKEGALRRYCGTVRLIGCDRAARIGVNFQLGDNERRQLDAYANIRE